MPGRRRAEEEEEKGVYRFKIWWPVDSSFYYRKKEILSILYKLFII